jgi:hypothetical protein
LVIRHIWDQDTAGLPKTTDYWKKSEQNSQSSLYFPDILYRCTSKTMLFSQNNFLFTFVKFLNYFRFSTSSFMFTFVRTGHLQLTLNPPLHEKYCTAMYTTEELKHCVLARV